MLPLDAWPIQLISYSPRPPRNACQASPALHLPPVAPDKGDPPLCKYLKHACHMPLVGWLKQHAQHFTAAITIATASDALLDTP
jgi:hypothetical protein